MNTDSTQAPEETKAKKTATKKSDAKPAAPAPSTILKISPNAQPADVDAAYKNYAATTKATHTASTNVAQRDAAGEVQKHHREHEEVRKALKKKHTQDLRDAKQTKVLALRAVQSAYDLRVNEVETENEKAVTDASHMFNDAVAPIHAALKGRTDEIDSEARKALSAAQAEFLVEKAAAEERARLVVEAKKAAEAAAVAKAVQEAEEKADAMEDNARA